MRGKRLFIWVTSPLISFFLRVFLGGVFLFAGVAKIADPHGFAQALSNYHLLPEWIINFMTIFLPWLETMVGASLLFGIMVKRGAFVATGLLAIFTLALGISLIRGLDITCGCFGTSSGFESISWLYLARDIILLLLGIHIILFDDGIASLDRLLRSKAR